jgi:uncharacterized protein (DUF362 family)
MPAKPCRSGEGITRRQFLSGTAAAAGCLAASGARRLFAGQVVAAVQAPGPMLRARTPRRTPVTNSQPKVVHVHCREATSWDFVNGWYGDHVSQHQVTRMVDQGLMALTGTASRAAAWLALLPGYAPGQRVAIKANVVNAQSLDDGDNDIDALIELVNSVVAGLKEIGVAEADIWVYDASRTIPNRFRYRCAYPGVQFSGLDVNDLGFSDTERVVFAPPAGGPTLADKRLSQVLVNADYLINMPIMKKHCCAHVTLAFKNHFGTIEKCWEVHEPTFPDTSVYRSDYSALVDIYQNPHIVGKTVLTIGDGLFASRIDQTTPPDPWVTFGNRAPNSLFFSQDPVAIDCVMYDFLEAEAGVPATADDYLVLAAQAGLGVFEHRAAGATDPADWYSLIDYLYLDLSWQPSHTVYLPSIRR